MKLPDVNLLIYAHRADLAEHAWSNPWLDACLNGDETIAISSGILSSFLRITTNRNAMRPPTPTRLALEFCEALLSAENVIRIGPGPRHWQIFSRLCDQSGSRGNDVPDAYIAALAIEQGCTLYTADRGFARYPGLRWQHPLDELTQA